MRRFDDTKDLTQYQRGPSPTLNPSRICWKCNRKKLPAGGKTDRRTRMWSCAACLETSK